MLVPILMGSSKDEAHADKIIAELDKFGIPAKKIVASAHKVPERVFEIVQEYNNSDETICYVTIAGRSNGLSGVTGANAIHPVVACPPFSDKADMMVNLNSTLQMPSDTPVITVLDPQNVAGVIARIFGIADAEMKTKVVERIKEVKAKF